MRKKYREQRKIHQSLEIYSNPPEKLLIIDKEHKILVTISAKGLLTIDKIYTQI